MAFTLGPLVISLPRLFLLAGIVTGLLMVYRRQRGDGLHREGLLWLALLAGFVTARLVYVALHFAHFAANPLEILRVWQGGFEPFSGAAATLLAAFGLARWRKLALQPMLAPVLAGLLVWGTSAWMVSALQASQQRPLPELALQTLDGAPAMLTDFRGRPVAVNVWATWCPPCRREMPVLARGAAENPEVHFVFLNQGENRETVQAFLAQQDLDLSNVLLDVFSRSGRELGARGLPTTLFFDAKGNLVTTHTGELSAPRLADQLRKIAASEP